jgi:hypothetical protein
VQYTRVAGIAFDHILTPNPSGVWRSLQAADPGGAWGDGTRPSAEARIEAAAGSQTQPAPRVEGSTRTLSVTMPEPPLLLAPFDGATVDESSLEVTCSVSMPEEIVSVRINGTEAEVSGERATASVILEPGPNRLTALIWRHSGLYRSFALGQVIRKES